MTAQVLRIPGTVISGTIPGTPTLMTDADILADGSLILIEPGNPTNPWAHIPADATTITNLAATQANALTGGTASVVWKDTFASVSPVAGRVEFTTKKGLHMVPSNTNGVLSKYAGFNLGSAIINYLDSHRENDIYMSIWARITRAPDTSMGRFQFAKIVSSGGTYTRVDIGNNGSNNSVDVRPTTNLGQRISYGGGAFLASVASTNIASGTTTTSDIVRVGPMTSNYVNKSAAIILYRFYVEDLTASSRDYATVDALDWRLYQQEMVSPGGRYLGDTYVAP